MELLELPLELLLEQLLELLLELLLLRLLLLMDEGDLGRGPGLYSSSESVPEKSPVRKSRSSCSFVTLMVHRRDGELQVFSKS